VHQEPAVDKVLEVLIMTWNDFLAVALVTGLDPLRCTAAGDEQQMMGYAPAGAGPVAFAYSQEGYNLGGKHKSRGTPDEQQI
jgi:hypothetical protein